MRRRSGSRGREESGRDGGPGLRAVHSGVLLLLVLVSGCALARAPGPPAPEPVAEGPAIREGVRDAEEAREAARLLAEGESLLSQGDAEGARRRALEVEERYAEATGSARALWLRARAEREMERWDEAEGTIVRYLDLLPRDDPLWGDAALFRVEVRHDGGMGGAVEALFQIPEGSDQATLEGAARLAERMAGDMTTPSLRDLIQEAPPHSWVIPPFLVELAVREALAGNDPRAQELVRRALELFLLPELEARATRVLDGRLEEEVAAVLGALLPESGSPSFQALAREVRDGVEVALAVEMAEGRAPVRFLPLDDRGEMGQVAAAVRSLEQGGATGIVGPVMEPFLEEVVRARSRPIPVISPTARMVPEGPEGVYSMTAAEPGPARVLARSALNRGVRSVVLLHPSAPDMAAEARWFREAFHEGGGVVVRTLTYPQGTATFGDQLTEVVRLRPRGLVLFLPPEDVELVAPQIAFYGVDDLEDLTILGNDAWSSQRVLETVPTRHTDGVLTVTSRTPAGDFGPGWARFVEAYEDHFRRTFRQPTSALGYDAARLLLEASRAGGGTPEGTLRALERIRDFPGATGILSVVDGQIRRAYVPVRIQGRELVRLSP